MGATGTQSIALSATGDLALSLAAIEFLGSTLAATCDLPMSVAGSFQERTAGLNATGDLTFTCAAQMLTANDFIAANTLLVSIAMSASAAIGMGVDLSLLLSVLTQLAMSRAAIPELWTVFPENRCRIVAAEQHVKPVAYENRMTFA